MDSGSLPVTATKQVKRTCCSILLPANEVCEGNVFTLVCHFVHRGGASFQACNGNGGAGFPACTRKEGCWLYQHALGRGVCVQGVGSASRGGGLYPGGLHLGEGSASRGRGLHPEGGNMHPWELGRPSPPPR